MDKSGNNVATVLVKMLRQTAHRGPDGCGVYIGGILRKENTLQNLDVGDVEGSTGFGHSRLRITGSSGIQPLWSCDRRFVLGFNGEIWNYKSIREELASLGHGFETDSDGEVIIHMIEENCINIPDIAVNVSMVSRRLDGEYAFALLDNNHKEAVLTRDPVGIKQIYYGHNGRYFAFCSEKKPLWDIGIDPQRVSPGKLVKTVFDSSLKYHEPKVESSNMLTEPSVKIHDEVEALRRYKEALFESVAKRIDGRDRVGIIFSGGVDSVLVAQIAKILSCDITCYATGFSDSPDTIAARQASNELGMDLKVHELNNGEIQAELENILSSIESTNHLQVDVAIPIFFALKEAKKDGMRVMLTGQGADEIFAGYPWYAEILEKRGRAGLNRSLWNDIRNLYKDTLEREDKIAMYYSLELRVPYLDPKVIETAMSISEDLKIRGEHVKYIHRKLAQEIGVPPHLAWRKKEAAQHGSNVHNNLIEILKNREVPGAASGHRRGEELGSAYRYNHGAYAENESIQNTLDHLGKNLGLHPRAGIK